MANNCYFEVKLVGKENEVREVTNYFTEGYDYSLFDWKKFKEKEKIFTEKMNLSKEKNLIVIAMDLYEIANNIFKKQLPVFDNAEKTLKILEKLMEERLRYYYKKWKSRENKYEVWGKFAVEFDKFKKAFDFNKFKELVALSNKKKEKLPKGNHFFRIFDFDVIDEGFYDNGDFYLIACGDCAWSLNSAVFASGYYDSWKEYEGIEWFKGTCLEKVHDKFPSLKIEMYSEEVGFEFSEYVMIDEKGIETQCEDLRMVYFDSVEEAEEFGYKDFPEEMLDIAFYKVLPSWFYGFSDESKDFITSYEFKWSI